MAWIEARHPHATVLADWPGIFEVHYPYAGYAARSHPILFLGDVCDGATLPPFDVMYAPSQTMLPVTQRRFVARFGLPLIHHIDGRLGHVDIYGPPPAGTAIAPSIRVPVSDQQRWEDWIVHDYLAPSP